MRTYRDASAPLEARVDDLLSQMELQEKVGQLMQLDGRFGMRDASSGCVSGRSST